MVFSKNLKYNWGKKDFLLPTGGLSDLCLKVGISEWCKWRHGVRQGMDGDVWQCRQCFAVSSRMFYWVSLPLIACLWFEAARQRRRERGANWPIWHNEKVWPCYLGETFLFTLARESSLFPGRFLTSWFLQNLWFMKPLFWGKKGGVSLHNFPGGKGMFREAWKDQELTCLTLFVSSYKQCRETPTIVLPSQQMLHKLRFLQQLGCQKPCWDQATLSSLVNKQVLC